MNGQDDVSRQYFKYASGQGPMGERDMIPGSIGSVDTDRLQATGWGS